MNWLLSRDTFRQIDNCFEPHMRRTTIIAGIAFANNHPNRENSHPIDCRLIRHIISCNWFRTHHLIHLYSICLTIKWSLAPHSHQFRNSVDTHRQSHKWLSQNDNVWPIDQCTKQRNHCRHCKHCNHWSDHNTDHSLIHINNLIAFIDEEPEEPKLTILTKQHKNAIRALRKVLTLHVYSGLH